MKPLQATSVQAHSNWKSFVGVAAPGDTAPIVKVKPVGVDWEKCQNEAFPLGLSIAWSCRGWVGRGKRRERNNILGQAIPPSQGGGVCVGGAVGGRASMNDERFIGTPSAERVLPRGVWGTWSLSTPLDPPALVSVQATPVNTPTTVHRNVP